MAPEAASWLLPVREDGALGGKGIMWNAIPHLAHLVYGRVSSGAASDYRARVEAHASSHRCFEDSPFRVLLSRCLVCFTC